MTFVTPAAELAYPDSELVLGLVAPIGTDLEPVTTWLTDRLSQFRYSTEQIRLSDFGDTLSLATGPGSPEGERIERLMAACNQMRREARRADVLALYAANAIHQQRTACATGDRSPRPRRASVLRSLKRPEEVATLRRIYGPGFFLIGLSSSRAQRLEFLTKDKGIPPVRAEALLQRDEAEDDGFGQRTGDTYHLADAFVASKEDVWRFLELIFGHPFLTPTKDEYAMFLAFAASVRSADLSRQVGAVVVSSAGEVIATGANDVPAPGGGPYWPDARDQRDYRIGADPNEKRRNAIVLEATRRLVPGMVGRDDDDVLAEAKQLLKGTALLDLTEFHRAVHAEMDALLSCARSGQSVTGATLFTTTYPCHNCTKHIVGAGIARVVYVEPYAKSLAETLHGDAMEQGESAASKEPSRKIPFVPFVGVGARRFIELFSMNLGPGDRRVRKGRSGDASRFSRADALLRVPMLPTSYIDREAIAATVLAELTEQELDP